MNSASSLCIVGKQVWDKHVVVQTEKIRLGVKLMWVQLKWWISWIWDGVFFFSPMLRNVRPVKTTCICPWKQLQKSVGHAGCCVDTCSAAARSAGVSVELDFTLSLCLVGISIFSPCSAGGSGFIIIIFFSLYCFFLIQTDSLTFSWHSFSLRDVSFHVFLSGSGSCCCAISDEIWRFSYQTKHPSISI